MSSFNSNPQTLLVVMPAYNSQATIAMAIESILNQSYKNLRLVIVDDASEDNTLKIAKMYLKDPRVSVYHNKKNLGAYYSRNVGLYMFRNKNWGYFTTHDADDVSFEHRYIKLIRMLRRPRYSGVQDTFRRVELRSGRDLGAHLTMAHAVFQRHVFDDIGYFHMVRFGADWEHWTRLNSWNRVNKFKTAAVTEVLGESFVHEKNLTVQIPINSSARLNYIKKVRQDIRTRNITEDWYRGFTFNDNTVEVTK